MRLSTAETRREPSPTNTEPLRLVPPEEDRSARAADAIARLAIKILKDLRELDEHGAISGSWKTADTVCTRLLRSKDRTDVNRGFRFVLTLEAQRIRHRKAELELVQSAIAAYSRIVVANLLQTNAARVGRQRAQLAEQFQNSFQSTISH